MRTKDGRPFTPGEDPAPAWARPLLVAGRLAFAAGVRARAAGFASGVLSVHRAALPVVSVGNLRVGGAGKTPFTLRVVEALLARGHRPAVLSRGYGRAAKGPVVVRPEALPGPEVAGDEPLLIARRAGVPVVVDPDRVRGAARAKAELGATVVVLDDGFQHRRLARDLDVVLLDPDVFEQALLPEGPLREPPSALARADLLVWVGGPAPSGAPGPSLEVEVAAEGVGPLEGPRRAPESLRGQRVALLSGIARPRRFEATARALGAQVVLHEAHPDHAAISRSTLDRFAARAAEAGAQVRLTTEKDAVRLGGAPELDVLFVGHRIVRGERALALALDALGGPA